VLAKVLSKTRLNRRETAVLRHAGGLSQLEWRALRLLVRMHGDIRRDQRSLGRLAQGHKTTRKTIWDWSTKLLAMSWSRLETNTAWETITELDLHPLWWTVA
jgi:hypothetical protein